jgi:hypothetical protein
VYLPHPWFPSTLAIHSNRLPKSFANYRDNIYCRVYPVFAPTAPYYSVGMRLIFRHIKIRSHACRPSFIPDLQRISAPPMRAMVDGFQSLPYFYNSIWTSLFGWKPSPILLLPAFLSGISILVLCVQCTLSIEAAKTSRQKNESLLLLFVVIRTLLAIPAIIIYIDAIMAPYISQSRHISSAAVTIGSYGIFKTWEICFAPLFDSASLPNWVPLSNPKLNGKAPSSNGIGNGKEIHREKVTTLSKENHSIVYS